MAAIQGDVDTLEASATTLDAAGDDLSSELTLYRGKVLQYRAATSTLPRNVEGRDGPIQESVNRLRKVADRPKVFATLLRALDRDGDGRLSKLEQLIPGGVDRFLEIASADPTLEPDQVLAALSAEERAKTILELQEQLGDKLDLDTTDIYELGWELSDEQLAELEAFGAEVRAHRDDPVYLSHLYETLGPEGALLLGPTLSVYARSGERDGVDPARGSEARAIAKDLSIGLGVADRSGMLQRGYVDDLIDAGLEVSGEGEDKLTLVDDDLVVLLRHGRFSVPSAQRVGQVGLDLMAGRDGEGEVSLGAPTSSPLWADEDNPYGGNTIEARVLALTSAANRTPVAMGALLIGEEGPRNVRSLLGLGQGRGHGPGSERWDTTVYGHGDALDIDLMTEQANTTIRTATAPEAGGRAAAAAVFEGSVERLDILNGIDDNLTRLSPSIGELTVTYLPDMALQGSATAADRDDPIALSNGMLHMGLDDAQRLVAISWAHKPNRAKILEARDLIGVEVAGRGMALERTEGANKTGWVDRLDRLWNITEVGRYAYWIDRGQDEQAAEEERVADRQNFVNTVAGLARAAGTLHPVSAAVVNNPWVGMGLDRLTASIAGGPAKGGQVDAQAQRNHTAAAMGEDEITRQVAASRLAVAVSGAPGTPDVLQADARVIALAKEHLGEETVAQIASGELDPGNLTGDGDWLIRWSNFCNSLPTAELAQASGESLEEQLERLTDVDRSQGAEDLF